MRERSGIIGKHGEEESIGSQARKVGRIEGWPSSGREDDKGTEIGEREKSRAGAMG